MGHSVIEGDIVFAGFLKNKGTDASCAGIR